MTEMQVHGAEFDPALVEVLLCDADGNLFPSEEPAFDASVTVTNAFLQRLGLPGNWSAEELRLRTTGKNFRTTAIDLAVGGGIPVEAMLARGHNDAVVATEDDIIEGTALTCAELDDWVTKERDTVTEHLAATLTPDARVYGPLERMGLRYALAAVSSSAAVRLQACFTATGLDVLIPPGVRFSAEDSLPVPTSKPDPAVYRFAGDALGIEGGQGLAIEDSVPGVLSAVGAGFPTVGNVMFVPTAERAARRSQLIEAGVCAVIDAWSQLDDMLSAAASPELDRQARRPA
ncbi:HAD family phosphatase [Mycobacterium deserti]|uniref:HAD family phosphatase n=1 Tax=Mycobacterium deserti TaxID=2978347 RepID=A0ABT2M5H4_9MYCO|nr:HAD family phosphatase [Mycobacterium deserti]MCT7657518.1 HAD family phosphatase [Mycobacterium deserti]